MKIPKKPCEKCKLNATSSQARMAGMSPFEVRNRIRRHAALGYVAPVEFEACCGIKGRLEANRPAAEGHLTETTKRTKESAMRMLNVLGLCIACLFSTTAWAGQAVPKEVPLNGPKLDLPDGLAKDKANEINQYLKTKFRFLNGHTVEWRISTGRHTDVSNQIRCYYGGSFEDAQTFIAMLQEHMQVDVKCEAINGKDVMFSTGQVEQVGNKQVVITLNKALLPAAAQVAAEELLVALKIPERLKQDFDRMKATLERHPDRQGDNEEFLNKWRPAHDWATTKKEYIEAVSALYTQEEFLSLVKFYSSSTGKKTVALEPGIRAQLYRSLGDSDEPANPKGIGLESEDFKNVSAFFSTDCGKKFLRNLDKIDCLLKDIPTNVYVNSQPR